VNRHQNDGMLITAAPCALLWPAAMILWGPGFTSSKHKHHSVQLIMTLDGNLRIRGGVGEKWRSCGAALVRPDAWHEVDATDRQLLLAFVDPESDLGASLLEKISSPIHQIEEAEVRTWCKALGDPLTLTSDRVNSWVLTYLLSGRRLPKLHPKVRRTLLVLREELTTRRNFTLNYLAGVAGLSQSRFMHVFTESVGVPVRPYVLWLRLQMACGEMMNGATVTQAAHRSGFSDAAHLTRTVRRMLGTTPGGLVRRRSSTKAAFAESRSNETSTNASARAQLPSSK
jgi:AraC-like DNA-binding protein